MRKKAWSLALSLAMCLVLAVPALAADTSGLDANGAKAFYGALSAYQDVVIYADLLDMNGDKSPELVVVSSPWPDGNSFDYYAATVDIWQMKGGQAVKTSSVECEAGTDTGMEYVSVGGELYLHAFTVSGRPGFHGANDTYVSAGGWEHLSCWWGEEPYDGLEAPAGWEDHIADEYNSTDFSRDASGSGWKEITRDEYIKYIQKYRGGSSAGDAFLSGGGQSWYAGRENAPSYQTVLNQLRTKANEAPAPAAGTFGPYTIAGSEYSNGEMPYTISFSAAKVEKKTVQVRSKVLPAFGGQPEIGSYQNREVTLITMKAGSSIKVAGGGDADGMCLYLTRDGNGRYTAVSEEFTMEFLTEEDLKSYIKDGAALVENKYIIEYETAGAASAPSGGFTDVKSGAYYEDAVNWAVEKGITSGTSAATFSPNQTCTVRQILTFLYRANGRPNASSGASDLDAAEDWAAGRKIISTAANTGAPCTRAMAVTYLWKAAGSPAPAKRASFTDVPASADYARAVSWAVEKGITGGTTATSFSPGATCTRGQIVTFLYRAMGK